MSVNHDMGDIAGSSVCDSWAFYFNTCI